MTSIGVRIKEAFLSQKRDEVTHRERWDSRTSFILAASGSAIGLGNLWRFPALAFKWGGGAFFIPYWMALFLIGIPIFILELSLGQVIQSGDVACFGGMNKRLRGVGLGSVYGGFSAVSYYNVIITWCLIYFVNCFRTDLPWAPVDQDVPSAEYFANGDRFFTERVLMVGGIGDAPDTMAAYQFAALCVTWFVIAMVLWRGVSGTSKVVYLTMILPLITIFILLIRGATLENSLNGVRAYIGNWDVSVLSQGQVWTEAVGQIFFSIGVTFGIMTAYSSYNSRHQDAVQDSIIVAMMNSGVSFFAGFAVFSTLGFISLKSGIPIEELSFSGPSLVFMTYPTALATLPGAQFFNAILFLTLFFLGIDSAFSLVEAVTTAIRDSKAYADTSRSTIILVTCGCSFLVGCMYITNIGLYLLDVVDYYINNLTMLFIGFMECLAASWIYRNHEQIEEIGSLPVWVLGVSWIGGTTLGCLIALPTGSSMAAGVALGLVIVFGGSAVAAILATRDARNSRDAMWTLFFYPVETLRKDLNDVLLAGNDDPQRQGRKKWGIPFIWSLLMKYFITPVLIILLAVGIAGNVAKPYGGYPASYQACGLVLSLFGIALVIVPMWKYRWLDSIMPAASSGHYLVSDEQTGIATELAEMKTGGEKYSDDEVNFTAEGSPGSAPVEVGSGEGEPM